MSSGAQPLSKSETIRLLVASPDPAFRKMLVQTNVHWQGRVEEVSSGSQALSRLESMPFDVLVLDKHLPDLNSQEIAELVRRRFARMEVRLVDSQAGAEKAFAETSVAPEPVPPPAVAAPRTPSACIPTARSKTGTRRGETPG